MVSHETFKFIFKKQKTLQILKLPYWTKKLIKKVYYLVFDKARKLTKVASSVI